MKEHEFDRLVQELDYIESVCKHHDVPIQFELEWIWDDYYVNVYHQSHGFIAMHLSSRGDFEDVWDSLRAHYPEVDWDDQEF